MKSAGVKRGHRLCLAVAMALGAASQAQALGLGAIEVKSQLGKPFVAEIPITFSAPNEADNLSVRLASSDAFARVGLERPNDQSANLQFSIGKNARGEPVVRVSTPRPMNDPYVSFLLEADWGRGKMVREYTALLDPPRTTAIHNVPIVAPVVQSTPMLAPVAAPAMPAMTSPTVSAPPPPVATAPAAPPESVPPAPPAPPPEAMAAEPMEIPPPIPVPPAPAEMPEPPPAPISAAPAIPEPPPAPVMPEPAPAPIAAAPEESPPPASPPPAAVAAAPAPEAPPANPGSRTVAPGDTLARIAVGLHGEASLNRMMIALQRANPDAFIHDNINLLKSGSVLRIPAREEVQTLSPDEANLLVQQQVESWHRSLRPSLQTEAETGAIARPVEQPAPATADAGSQPEVARPVKPKARPKAEIAQSKAAKPDVAKPAADTAANDETANKPAARPAIARVSRAHLEIVPPVGSGSRGTQSGASAGGSGSELRAELAQTKEDLAARKAEIGELKSRVGDLEKMQQDNQSLLAMKDSKLAEMQQRLAELEKNSATTPAGNANAASAASSSATATGPASVMPTSTANASADAAASPTRPEILAKAAKPVPQAGVVETPWYQRPLVLIGAGLLLLGGLLGLMLRHGRRPPDTAARVGRYSSGTLAASLASVRAAAAEGGSGATESPVPEEQAVDHASVVVQPAAVPPVVAADIPVTAAASAQQVRRPYWAGPNVATPKVQEASGPIVDPQADKPAPKSAATKAAAPKGKSADAASAAGNDDWALDAQPASAAAVTRQRPAAPAAGESDQGVATKMELARAYIDIGDAEGARGMLEEVLMEGTASQREDALKLLETLE